LALWGLSGSAGWKEVSGLGTGFPAWDFIPKEALAAILPGRPTRSPDPENRVVGPLARPAGPCHVRAMIKTATRIGYTWWRSF